MSEGSTETAQVTATGTGGGSGGGPGSPVHVAGTPGQNGGAGTQVHVRGGAGAHGASPAEGDRSAEQMLTDAAAGDGDGGKADDPLAKAQAEIDRWKTQARENEKRAKTNAAKAQQYDAYEESQKTEQQKLTDQLTAAQEDARKAHEERFRLLACAQYDLPPELIPHLGGGSEDEINERAEAFAAAINSRAAVLAAAQGHAANGQQQPARPPGPMRPVEALRPGALPAGDAKPQDPNAWVRRQLNKR
jgi:hypothetical protein